MTEQKQLLSISKKAFLNVIYILLILILSAGILTLFIKPGVFLRDSEGMVISGSFSYIEDVNYPVWRWLTAPFEVLGGPDALSVIMIGLFLIILGGTFGLMHQTGGMKVIIKRLIQRYKHNKYMLLRMIIFIFMIFGAFFGIFEESIALLPILIILSLSMGWDTMTGMGMCLLAAGFGFATAITNPFSIGIASDLANTNILSGVVYRLIIFVIMYGILQFFLVAYAKKIEMNPEKSLTYKDDLKKKENLKEEDQVEYQNEAHIFKVYVTLFIVLLIGIITTGLLELLFNLSIPAIPVMAAIFLIGGLISGYLVTHQMKYTFKTYLKGMLGVLPAFILILLAVSVKHIISNAQIMDTILYYLSNMLDGQSPWIAILFIYLFVLIIQFFIGSASAKAFLIMPIILPLVSLIGITSELAILAFIFGDGYTNVIFPTNGVLLIGLSIASVSYSKWFKFTYKIQLMTLLLTVIFLVIGIFIGY
jgi:uncharacterized ion transporter superfamily protein YfcC